jgi:hypothetical protein
VPGRSEPIRIGAALRVTAALVGMALFGTAPAEAQPLEPFEDKAPGIPRGTTPEAASYL